MTGKCSLKVKEVKAKRQKHNASRIHSNADYLHRMQLRRPLCLKSLALPWAGASRTVSVREWYAIRLFAYFTFTTVESRHECRF